MKKILAAVGTSILPAVAFAQANFSTVGNGIASISNIISQLIYLVIGVGVLLFLIGVLQFVTAGGDEEKREAGRNMMVFGIIALFVMTAVWGFVNILGQTIFGENANVSRPGAIPSIPTPGTN